MSVDRFSVNEDEKQNKIGVNIRVSDQGPGIKEVDRPDLFKFYFKSKDETSRRINKDSHGIGLSVCKKFA